MEITKENKYSTKDIAKWIRETLKKDFKEYKFSVRYESYSGGSSINLTMLKSPVRLIKKRSEVTEQDINRLQSARNNTTEEVMKIINYTLNASNHQINQYHIDADWSLTENGKNVIKQILQIANKYNYDNSDVMTDYFDVNYYLHFNLGSYDKPFIQGA